MNVSEITNTIIELENGDTTFASCEKLASLYIVRDHLSADEVIAEYNDILPSDRDYCIDKAEYQKGNKTKEFIVSSINNVCKETNEFLFRLYCNTDMTEERIVIKDMLIDVLREIDTI